MDKLLSPAFYKGQWATTKVNLYNYYHPLMKSGSAKPLWHIMLATSVIMYTTSYVCYKNRAVKAARVEAKSALVEYRHVHGSSGHH